MSERLTSVNLSEKFHNLLTITKNDTKRPRKTIICDEIDKQTNLRTKFYVDLSPIAEETEMKKRIRSATDDLNVPRKKFKGSNLKKRQILSPEKTNLEKRMKISETLLNMTTEPSATKAQSFTVQKFSS